MARAGARHGNGSLVLQPAGAMVEGNGGEHQQARSTLSAAGDDRAGYRSSLRDRFNEAPRKCLGFRRRCSASIYWLLNRTACRFENSVAFNLEPAPQS
jgi:hypothetical protein